MNKKEEFKEFIKSHPNLVGVVERKKHTWQDLFEIFDLYGNNEEAWNRYLNIKENISNTTSNSIGELTKLFKNINIDNVQKYIDTAGKAVGIVQELMGNSSKTNLTTGGPTSPRPINKIFED